MRMARKVGEFWWIWGIFGGIQWVAWNVSHLFLMSLMCAEWYCCNHHHHHHWTEKENLGVKNFVHAWKYMGTTGNHTRNCWELHFHAVKLCGSLWFPVQFSVVPSVVPCSSLWFPVVPKYFHACIAFSPQIFFLVTVDGDGDGVMCNGDGDGVLGCFGCFGVGFNALCFSFPVINQANFCLAS